MEAGLAEQIQASASIAYLTQVSFALPEQVPQKLIDKYLLSKGGAKDFDLHYLRNILVSVGWNKNDDVFDPTETYSARHTPEDKPVNYEHNFADIIGHTIGSEVIDENGKAVANDIAIEDLPERFHIYTNDVLYKIWPETKLQERMDKIVAEIYKNEWFVSMECLFKGFDYALINTSGKARVIARNSETAFLTKKLKAYGGQGLYEGEKVGRLLRNIVFSGKGLVRKPANPDSVFILTASENNLQNFNFKENMGYKFMSENNKSNQSDKMASETEVALQKQVAELQAQLQKVNESKLAEQLKAAQDEIAKLKSDSEKQVEVLKAEVDSKTKLENETKSLKAKVEETEKTFKTVNDELTAIKAEQNKNKRIAVVEEKLKLSKEEATKHVETFASLNDEQFNANVAVMVKAMEAWTTNNPADGNSNVPRGKVSEPAKSTPAQLPSQSTSAPQGTGKNGKTLTVGSENADVKALETAEVDNKTVALSTESTNNGVESLRKSIAQYLKPELAEQE